ncbi:MAG: sulfotransferase [Flavobacteriales bacterium]|nr:sulfotransferase [Flavobacteriales bacterium]
MGSPRSGTTWLSRMLGDHPQVAALDQGSPLFSAYLAPVLSAWSKGRALGANATALRHASALLQRRVHGRFRMKLPPRSMLACRPAGRRHAHPRQASGLRAASPRSRR